MFNIFLSFQDDFDSLRPLCYPNTDAFLLCFSVVTPTSFHNITEKWVPEVRKHCPKAPIILVGTQCDLRNDVKVLIELAHYKEQPIPESEAQALAERIGASYIECSSLTQRNLKEVFDTALLSALRLSGPLKRTKSSRRSKKAKKQHEQSPPPMMADKPSVKKTGWKRFCCFIWVVVEILNIKTRFAWWQFAIIWCTSYRQTRVTGPLQFGLSSIKPYHWEWMTRTSDACEMCIGHVHCTVWC